MSRRRRKKNAPPEPIWTGVPLPEEPVAVAEPTDVMDEEPQAIGQLPAEPDAATPDESGPEPADEEIAGPDDQSVTEPVVEEMPAPDDEEVPAPDDEEVPAPDDAPDAGEPPDVETDHVAALERALEEAAMANQEQQLVIQRLAAAQAERERLTTDPAHPGGHGAPAARGYEPLDPTGDLVYDEDNRGSGLASLSDGVLRLCVVGAILIAVLAFWYVGGH
jgi:hypothetical protein